jgi:hypothetical protein
MSRYDPEHITTSSVFIPDMIITYYLFKYQARAKALDGLLGDDDYIAETQRRAIGFLTYFRQYITTPYVYEEFSKCPNKLGYLFAGFILLNTKLVPFIDNDIEAIYWTEDEDFVYVTARVKSDLYSQFPHIDNLQVYLYVINIF